eukprot:850277-Prymnesium_polylepis.1
MLVGAVGEGGKDAVREACDQLDSMGRSPLHYLCQAGKAGHPAALRILLRASANPNVQSLPPRSAYTSGQWGRTNANGEKQVLEVAADRTPLHLVLELEEPSSALVRLLLEHGADTNLRDNEGRTALHLALDFEGERGEDVDLEMVELLLQRGADPSMGNDEIGMASSCLHAAAAANELEVVKLLLRHGAPHSAPGKGGWTPLAIAVRAGAARVVEALLAAGADPDASTPSGKTVRELAVVNRKEK